jgi:putative tryptophan/tyrosine transport system substrate-binding protein
MKGTISAALTILALMTMSFALAAEGGSKLPRVGYIGPGSSGSAQWARDAFLEGMHDLGYVEGATFIFEPRYFGDDVTAVEAIVADLLRSNPAVIVAPGSLVIRALQAATRTTPIVMTAVADPVNNGFVESLAKPGGNITGLTVLSEDLASKRIELLKDTISSAHRVAVLQHPSNPSHPRTLSNLDPVARAHGLTLRAFLAHGPKEFDRAFDNMKQWPADAALVLDEGVFVAERSRIAAEALRRSLPLVCGFRQMAEAGCLLSYAGSLHELNYRAASYVDKILKGAKPTDLPVELPTKFELVINLRTAKALGITIPASILARADEVIE